MDSSDDENNPNTECQQDVKVSGSSDQKDSASSGKQNGKICEDNKSSSLARTKTRERNRDPDKDLISEQDRSNASIYSEDYDDSSLSDGSVSQRSPSPTPPKEAKTQKAASTSVYKKGVCNGIPRHLCTLPLLPLQRLGSHQNQRHQNLSKNGPSKDQDEVAKRLLSARLMKISELKNALAELQLRNDELQKENRLLKQLQLRHEKALHRYSDTEGGISQLISRHNNEMRVMQEKLRRSQEKERIAERRCTDTDAQLQRCRDQLHKLQQLADDQGLGERDQLARKLAHALVKLQESERRVKELEKKFELSNGSFQRQLAGERKKTYYAHQETQKLWQELNTLSAKLKERERELDTKNIYAIRKPKAASRKDSEDFSSMKDGSRSSSKAVQTENRVLPLDFSSPPAVMNGSEVSCGDQADDSLSLKERQSSKGEQRKPAIQETARESEEERAYGMKIKKQERKNDKLRESEREIENQKETLRKQRIHSDLSEDKGTGTENTHGSDRDEANRKTRSEWQTKGEKGKDKQTHLREQEIQANQERAEEERRRKDLLLAKMREIDMQAEAQDTSFFNSETENTCTPSQDQDTAIFHLKQPHENMSTPKAGRRGGALKSQDLELTFGSYAPTFDKPATRAGIGHQSSSQSSGDNNDGMDLSELANGKKSKLMGQLFGASASPAPHVSTGKMELLSSPSTKSPSSGRRKGAEAPNRQKRTTMQVSRSGPAVRAITTLGDDIEEIKL